MIKCKEYIFRELYFDVKHYKLVRKLYHGETLKLSDLSSDELFIAKDLEELKVVIINKEKEILYLNMHFNLTKSFIRIIRYFERT